MIVTSSVASALRSCEVAIADAAGADLVNENRRCDRRICFLALYFGFLVIQSIFFLSCKTIF
jgi:hypothetical protein